MCIFIWTYQQVNLYFYKGKYVFIYPLKALQDKAYREQ